MKQKIKNYTIELTLSGIGYKAENTQESLFLYLGYSHPIQLKIPKEIEVSVKKEPKPTAGTGENQRLLLTGSDFNFLSNYAQQIKKFRKPDAYKAKGVIIQNKKDLEAIKVFRKEGKRKN